MQGPFVLLTGASGVGKTTIARAIREQYPHILVYEGDVLDPPTDEFLASIGPTEGPGGPIQRGRALYWIGKIALELQQGHAVLLDSQCRLAFLQEAISRYGLLHATIVLVECRDATRERRLHGRGSADLVHEQMANWARYLHREAVEAGCQILDTGVSTLDDSIARVAHFLHAEPHAKAGLGDPSPAR